MLSKTAPQIQRVSSSRDTKALRKSFVKATSRGWGDSSVGQVLTALAWWLEFGAPATMLKMCSHGGCL